MFGLLLGEFASPVEANQLRLACQAVNSAVKPFALAIGFALTRTSLNSLSLTLRQWHDIWHSCASAVDSQGLDASAWGYSLEYRSSRIASYRGREFVDTWLIEPTLLAPVSEATDLRRWCADKVTGSGVESPGTSGHTPLSPQDTRGIAESACNGRLRMLFLWRLRMLFHLDAVRTPRIIEELQNN